MKHTFTEECPNTDCHLKCSLAKTCQKCGDKRAFISDWRNILFLVPFPAWFGATLFGMTVSWRAYYYRYEPLSNSDLFWASAYYLLPGLLVSGALLYWAIRKGTKFGNHEKCCHPGCSANLYRGKCKQCGHPPAVRPFIYYYLTGFLALPAAMFGACMYSLPLKPQVTATGNVGLIVAAAAVITSLTVWSLNRK